ncbi:MAG: ferritin-like domain-containing protein [Rikenellaceae bacterium]
MKTKEKSIELLNKAIADELSAVHQYMYFHFRLNDLGYDLLSSLFKRTAIQEMSHVEHLAERILFLKGEPEIVAATPVKKIHDVKDMLSLAIGMEAESVLEYNLWANECATQADSMSKKLFERLVEEEELHLDQFEIESENMKNFGDNYLALQSLERSKSVSIGNISQ